MQTRRSRAQKVRVSAVSGDDNSSSAPATTAAASQPARVDDALSASIGSISAFSQRLDQLLRQADETSASQTASSFAPNAAAEAAETQATTMATAARDAGLLRGFGEDALHPETAIHIAHSALRMGRVKNEHREHRNQLLKDSGGTCCCWLR